MFSLPDFDPEQSTPQAGASDPAAIVAPQPLAFDAFVSYASVQRSQARGIQRFLQRAGPASAPRMKAYLDETDIRGGELQVELGQALDCTRHLVVCCSPEAADSLWVRAEIQRFLRHHVVHDIVLAWLSGPLERAVPAGLSVIDLRYHDLRRWWFNRWPWPRTGLELARMYARVANAPLRDVVDWERRRTLVNLGSLGAFGVCAAGATVATIVHQNRSAEARLLLDRLAADGTHHAALLETRQAPLAVRERAVALVAEQPARAAVALRSGWPVAVIGLEGDLAVTLLPALRDALVTTAGDAIPEPRMGNYRYAVAMVQRQDVLQREAAALLRDVLDANEVQGQQDAVYWWHARRAALMDGYIDVLERLANPAPQVDALGGFAKALERSDAGEVFAALDVVANVLNRRGLAFRPPRRDDEDTAPTQVASESAPKQPEPDPILAMRAARALLNSEPRPGQAAADYARAAPDVHDAGLLDAELASIESMLLNPVATHQVPELLKMLAVLAAQQADEDLVRRVAARLDAALLRPHGVAPLLQPHYRGAGFINFPAPLDQLPSRLLDTAEPRVLTQFVARYAGLGRPGLAWADLRNASSGWNDLAAKLLGSTRLMGLIREEQSYLDNPLSSHWAEEIASNCVNWLAYVDDSAALKAELAALAELIQADFASDRVRHLLTIYQATGMRLWADLHQTPDRQEVMQILALVPHPMWYGRSSLVAVLTSNLRPAIGIGLGSFLAWAAATYGLRPALRAS